MGNGYLRCRKLCANVLIVVILVAEHITTWYLLRGVYDRELPHAAFLRQRKTVNVFSCDICMDPFVEDNIIVYLYIVSLISYLYDYYDSNTLFFNVAGQRGLCDGFGVSPALVSVRE